MRIAVFAGPAIACALPLSPALGASLSFSGYAGEAPFRPATDVVTYLENAFCAGKAPGMAMKDPNCRKVLAWKNANIGRPRAAWSPPPMFD